MFSIVKLFQSLIEGEGGKKEEEKKLLPSRSVSLCTSQISEVCLTHAASPNHPEFCLAFCLPQRVLSLGLYSAGSFHQCPKQSALSSWAHIPLPTRQSESAWRGGVGRSLACLKGKLPVSFGSKSQEVLGRKGFSKGLVQIDTLHPRKDRDWG